MTQLQTLTPRPELDLSIDPDDFIRLPGLLRRWELEQVVTSGSEYRIEEAGELSDRTPVFAVFRREARRPQGDDESVGIPVGLSFDGGQLNVQARLLPIGDGEPVMAALVLGNSPEDAATLARVREHLDRARSVPPAPTSAAEAQR